MVHILTKTNYFTAPLVMALLTICSILGNDKMCIIRLRSAIIPPLALRIPSLGIGSYPLDLSPLTVLSPIQLEMELIFVLRRSWSSVLRELTNAPCVGIEVLSAGLVCPLITVEIARDRKPKCWIYKGEIKWKISEREVYITALMPL